MKTAVIQIHSSHQKSDNIKKACDFIAQAASAGAKFILLPEVFTFRGAIRASKGVELSKSYFMDQVADDISGPTVAAIRALAQKHKIYILAGSMYERSEDPERAYNTSVLTDSSGNIQSVYRKIHLFNATVGDKKYSESDYFLAGENPEMTKIGDFSVGMSVCYDVRFPEMYREYRRLGADVFCVPSAFTQATGQAHWKTLICCRAIENFCYVLAPNQVGADNMGKACYGHSLIVDPWGSVVAEASGEKEEIIYAELSKEVIKQKREAFG